MSWWSKAPVTLRVWVAFVVVFELWRVVWLTTFGTIAWGIFGLVVCFFLLRGVRWLWIVSVVFTALYVAGFLLTVHPLWAAENLLALLLLVMPQTRRYFARDRNTTGLADSD
jgi:hypothetical protein